jgi:hypothetical protein
MGVSNEIKTMTHAVIDPGIVMRGSKNYGAV